MSRSRYSFHDKEKPYFLTATVNKWLPLFTRRGTVEIVLESWRYLQNTNHFKLYGYVILENHLHMVAGSNDLGKDIQRFKSYTAHQIVEYLQHNGGKKLLEQFALFKRQHKKESTHQIWEEGSHPQVIETEAMMTQKLDYIHLNPVKRGYVDEPEHWRYSSARNYAGRAGLLDVICDW